MQHCPVAQLPVQSLNLSVGCSGVQVLADLRTCSCFWLHGKSYILVSDLQGGGQLSNCELLQETRASLNASWQCWWMLPAGDKSESKALMTAAGVPVVPGYHGEDQSLDRSVVSALDMPVAAQHQ